MRRLLRALNIVFLSGAIVLLVLAAVAQEVDHNGRGQHPAKGAPDPYARAVSTAGYDCCHGTDCARFYGTPTRAERGGIKGWMFGKWFVPDDRIIKPETIDASERAFHHLCLNCDETVVRCGHIAANG